MTCKLISKSDLSSSQEALITERLKAPAHNRDWIDVDIPSSWENYPPSTLFAFFENDQFIGIVEVSGPLYAKNASWWIDKSFRGRGYGTRLCDALASTLLEMGTTGIGGGALVGQYQDASSKMSNRLRALIAAGISIS